MQKLKQTIKQEKQLSPLMLEYFKQFETSYNKRGGYKTYTVPASTFMDFFQLCDQNWSDIPSYEEICATFTQEQLEHAMPALKWLANTNKIQVDNQTSIVLNLKGGIYELLAYFGDKIPVELKAYLDYLAKRMLERNLKPITIRGMMQTAIYLYIEMRLDVAKTLSQEQIDAYLKHKGGAAPQLSIFCKFLNENFGTHLICKCPPKKKPVIANKGYDQIDDIDRKACEKAFIELVMLPKPLNDKQRLAWINYALKYFHWHDIHLKKLSEINILDCNENPELMIVKHQDIVFHIPKFEQLLFKNKGD